jgi:hypothetical protein
VRSKEKSDRERGGGRLSQGRPTFSPQRGWEVAHRIPPAASNGTQGQTGGTGELSKLTESVQSRADPPSCEIWAGHRWGPDRAALPLLGVPLPQVPSGVPRGVPARRTFLAPVPSARSSDLGPALGHLPATPGVPAPACPRSRGALRPRPAPHTGRKSPRPASRREQSSGASVPGSSSPRGALSPQGARTTRRRAWAPWCPRYRRLPLSPAYRRPGKQRSAGAEAAARSPAQAAAAATSTSRRGSAHP